MREIGIIALVIIVLAIVGFAPMVVHSDGETYPVGMRIVGLDQELSAKLEVTGTYVVLSTEGDIEISKDGPRFFWDGNAVWTAEHPTKVLVAKYDAFKYKGWIFIRANGGNQFLKISVADYTRITTPATPTAQPTEIVIVKKDKATKTVATPEPIATVQPAPTAYQTLP